MTNKLRVSYSLLSAVEKGDWNAVVSMLNRVYRQPTPAMEDGLRIHKEIEKHIICYNNFPEWLFQGGLVLPKCEEKVVISYNDMIDISGIFDCIDDATKTLYEFKTGTQSSVDWARTHQIPMYFMMLERLGREVEKAFLIHYNQHTKKKDWVVIHNSPEMIAKAENYVETYANEIILYLQNNNMGSK